jgi:broad specificity phosphatase PhoE
MPQTVWIARHGNRLDFVNPEWFNTADRRYDPPLSDDGFIQAAELAARLKSENIAHIFASPFLRTIQTAHEIARVLDLSIELEAGLSEWHNPEWMSEHPEIHPPAFLAQKYSSIDWNYKSYFAPKYPESKEDVNRRTAKTIKKLVAEFTENILIVGHGATVHGVTYGLVPDTDYFKVALCCLTKVVRQQDDKWKLDLCADTSHLSETESEIRLN